MTHSRLRQLSIDQLVRGRYQPRRHFDAAQLSELAESIRATGGLLQPVIVRATSADQYEIIAGERRWRAAQIAGLSEISCLVGHYTDEQALQASIVENTSRADLNPIEEAMAYQRLIDEFQYLHEEVAAAVGKSRVAVTNALRLLRLDQGVQAFLIQGLLSEGHGKILAGIETEAQLLLAKECVDRGWSVRRLEKAVKKILKNENTEGPYSDPNIRRLATALSDHLGNDVHIECEARGGGFVQIRFNNVDELEGHFERMGFEYESA